MRGWELLSICLSFFPPSFRFLTCLDGYINRTLDQAAEQVSFCYLIFIFWYLMIVFSQFLCVVKKINVGDSA